MVISQSKNTTNNFKCLWNASKSSSSQKRRETSLNIIVKKTLERRRIGDDNKLNFVLSQPINAIGCIDFTLNVFCRRYNICVILCFQNVLLKQVFFFSFFTYTDIYISAIYL